MVQNIQYECFLGTISFVKKITQIGAVLQVGFIVLVIILNPTVIFDIYAEVLFFT